MNHYKLKRFTEQVGPVSLELETLENLDEAIDDLCERAGLGAANPDQAATRALEELCPYFGVIWPAARALSEHLAKMGNWLKAKKVLEVGCGLALPSLVATKLGAQVTATDFHPDVPRFLERNLALNGLALDYRHLNWQDKSSGLGLFDFVVGSDILYEAKHPPFVARALASHCKKDGHILLGDPGRTYLQSFVDELGKLGFRGDTFIVKDVFVLSYQRK